MTTTSTDPTGHPTYVGRFAPSPSGPLHRGSLVAALASWLDARAHGGRWLVRIENLDPPRERPGAADTILRQLAGLGLHWDGDVVRQSERGPAYAQAFERLRTTGRVYGCACTRRELALAAGDGEAAYPGTCRDGLAPGRRPRAWRLRLDDGTIDFEDRWHGPQRQHPARSPGDVVLKRADGLWAYPLAVVVDDAAAGVTDVVRGADLLPVTGAQIQLQRALGLPGLRHLHVPLVRDPQGRKLSKHAGDAPVGLAEPLPDLASAARSLGLPTAALTATDVAGWLQQATRLWQAQFGPGTLPPSSTAILRAGLRSNPR